MNSHTARSGAIDENSGYQCIRARKFRNYQRERYSEASTILTKGCHDLCQVLPVQHIDGFYKSSDLSYDFNGLMTLSITYGGTTGPLLTHTLQSQHFSRKVLDGMRQSLRMIVQPEAFRTVPDIVVHILALLEESVIQIQAYQLSLAEQEGTTSQKRVVHQVFGPRLNFDSIPDIISKLIGLKPKAILQFIGKVLHSRQGPCFGVSRIVHCELVMRTDFSRRFMAKREEMKTRLLKCEIGQLKTSVPAGEVRKIGTDVHYKEDLVNYLTTPKLTFHGTTPGLVASIVQYGFLKPGDRNPKTGTPLPVRCGSTYGRGIYSSPYAAFSLVYSGRSAMQTQPHEIPGKKLLICATLMGRSATIDRSHDWRQQSAPYPGADSHVANNQNEYIVFDSAQILPCYVVHLDWGQNTSTVAEAIRKSAPEKPCRITKMFWPNILDERARKEATSPGEKQRAKAEQIARGQKYFAYGFGSMTGNKLVIEDVAEVDDDDDDEGYYGGYPGYSKEEMDLEQAKSVWNWDDGEAATDQCGIQRKAAAEKKKWDSDEDD